MDALTIVLIVLVVAAIWAVIELALMFRRTRKSVAELTDSVNGVLDEARPVITKLDGAADELVPASKRLDPILEKAATSVDLLNVDLVRVEGILSDVNTVTDTGARASAAVSGAADAVASGVAGVVGKVAGKVSGSGKGQGKLAGATSAQLEAPAASETAPEGPAVERVTGDAGYFTYPAEAPSAEAANAFSAEAATGEAAKAPSAEPTLGEAAGAVADPSETPAPAAAQTNE